MTNLCLHVSRQFIHRELRQMCGKIGKNTNHHPPLSICTCIYRILYFGTANIWIENDRV